MEFSSEGFDLDALAQTAEDSNRSNQNDDNVVYEIGGGVSRLKVNNDSDKTKEKTAKAEPKVDTDNASPTWQADALKQQGNDAFRERDWREAVHLYTAAVDATPGPKAFGAGLLKQRDEWKRKEQARARQEMQRQEEARRQETQQKQQREREERESSTGGTAEKEDHVELESNGDEKELEEPEPPQPFQPPPHPHAEQLAIYHCNRAAALLQLHDDQDKDTTTNTNSSNDNDAKDPKQQSILQALDDCDIALLLKPNYLKALVRRCTVHERMDNTELALKDARSALELDPSNIKYKRNVQRLETLERERMDKLKAETMDKLKDLGNSILGNFGLSLDNFKAVQDPKTGSYSISFDQGAGGGDN